MTADLEKGATDGSSTQQRRRAAFFIIGSVPLLVAGFLAYEIYLPHSGFRGAKEVTIAPGLGSRMIAALLKQEGVIGSKWAFVTYISLSGDASSLKPGRYVFSDTETIPEISRAVVAGASQERVMVIPEGWNVADIARYLALQGIAREEITRKFFAQPPDDLKRRFPFLSEKRGGMGLEGYLFPDTYRIFYGATLEEITLKMLENFDRKMAPDLREAIARQKKTIFEIVTMASLIEKEVAGDQDRALVSGILWKRLAAGIPLQVDATLVYIRNQEPETGNRTTGGISPADKKVDSPYNTYRYAGLPRSPIANPGLSAIRAAISPRASPYLYYLSAPDGRTIFSRTLEEHNTAKAKYLHQQWP